MKKIFTFTALLLIAATLLGQAPASFKYQAVLRDSRGNIKANVTANIKIDILEGSSSGNIVYSENHSVTTNMYGLINLEVGNGVATKGSFSVIDWGTSTYFIKIFVDGVEMGTDQLLSVPYALNAKTADKITGGFKEKDSIFVASPAYGVTSGNITNWSTAYDWGNHATAGYLKASSQNDISNWNTAFGWGNHAKAGYLTTEKDPIFFASPAGEITSGNITNWNTAFGWGDHATAGYLKASSQNDISNWNTAFGWGNHAKAGYLTTEIDPIFLASPAGGITSNNISNWKTAFDWGDHATAGYLKAFTEIDPIFGAWDKSTGISITASQVSDLNSSVTNNAAVLENTVKNSYPATDKLKLAGIQDSAEVNVNADWNATSGDAQIVNKPILSTVAISGSYNDLTNKPVISAGSNIGDMQYWNGTAWVMVPIGQPGQFLKLNASNIPEWAGVLPSVITTSVSSITDVSSVSGGTVTSDGGGTITARGICFSTSQSPTTSNNIINSGAGTGSFVSNLSGLSYATTYYLKAFATNSAGTSYGSEVSFKTNPVLPTLTTTAISSITQTTASSGGHVSNDGGASITARGICWSTSANPSTANSKTSDGTGIGIFTSNLESLIGNTTYFVRAYATNSVGTNYGNEVSFKTSPVLPVVTTTAISDTTQTTATSGGNVTNDGGAEITARGVCWSTSASPTTSEPKTTDGTGSGTFGSSLSGLTGNTTYFVRAYATNSVGTNYGSEITFKSSPFLPTVTTTAISDTTQTTATSGGNVTNDGGANVTVRGICWSTSANPTIADSKTSDATGTGVFTSNLTGLTGNTLYYVRAYATNSVGTNYGSEISFKTTPVLPTITTTAITVITQTTATSGGSITNDGGGSITARGVCWSTSTNPTTAGSKTTDGTGTEAFASNMTGLSGNTNYYVRAYATNRAGTNYGSEISFKTSPVLPAVTTTAITAINATISSSGGNATNDGGSNISERGVCWSTSSNPTTFDNKATNGSGTGVFTVNLYGLTGMTTYYVRAYAINSVGTAYGSVNTFTTLGGGVFTDSRDLHDYKWVIIGTQSWMAENLAYLPSVSPSSTGSRTDQMYYVHSYEGNSVNEAKASANYLTYGVLYNWEAAKTGCPSGWHLPSNVDWNILWNYLGSLGECTNNGGGGKIKEIGIEHWSSPNTGATNSSGFTALPGDSRGNGGSFSTLGYGSSFWSTNTDTSYDTSTAHIWKTQYNINGFCWGGNADRSSGYQVRCVKD